jgi:hypothetical protein
MKKVVFAALSVLGLIACEVNTTNTKTNIDSTVTKLDSTVEKIGDKAEEVWDSTKEKAKDLKEGLDKTFDKKKDSTN